MSYILKSVTINTDNSKEGMEKIEAIWRDISTGKIPVIFDSEGVFQRGISPISKYSNYSSDESGYYDITIMGVNSGFFKDIDEKVSKGLYKKYDISDEDGDINVCTKKAWEKVWSEQSSGFIKRAFTEDYESTVPAEYTKDGKAHCYLYIAVK